jgi:hypothetical protein
MGLDRILEMLTERGLTLFLAPDGRPHVRGPAAEVTPAVKEALAAYREEIIARLKPPPPPPCREYLWRFGYREKLPPDFNVPVGAWWWRMEGEFQWKPVPGTPGETEPPPEGACAGPNGLTEGPAR